MLQGPLGPFFDRLASWLQRHGVHCQRVVFQGGDELDCRHIAPIRYTGTLSDWPTECQRLLERNATDCVLLFGQARAYHQAAIQVARQLGIAVIVLEEGYFRPGYVTMELDGVNGYSTTLDRFHWDPAAPGPCLDLRAPDDIHGQFKWMALHAARHYVAMALRRSQYPHYQHHRAASPWYYARYWMFSWLRKAWRYIPDAVSVRQLSRQPYYFVPLQHDGDSQITHHSPYRENTRFITAVLESFAAHAPRDTTLVFRQHPMSRGAVGHKRFIQALAAELGIAPRVVFLVEGHTPTLVRNARGVILINSTVGVQALRYKKPLKALGHALYDCPGLTSQEPLDSFWTALTQPNAEKVQDFLEQLRHLTQLPCNVYGRMSEPLHWTVK